MPKEYSKAPDECRYRVEHLLKVFHPKLLEVKLQIDLISVSTDGEGPALTLNGYKCAAVVRILGPKERTMERGDCEIVIDEELYTKLSDAEKDALLDHELYHIAIRYDKNDKPILDENGRPKLRLKKHDYQFGWFVEIANRHGMASMEVKQAKVLYVNEQQSFFQFYHTAPLPLTAGDSGPMNNLGESMKGIVRDGSIESVTITSGSESVRIDKDGAKAVDAPKEKKARKPRAKK